MNYKHELKFPRRPKFSIPFEPRVAKRCQCANGKQIEIKDSLPRPRRFQEGSADTRRRISLSDRIEVTDVRIELVPASVATEGVQAHHGLVSGTAPELSGALESTLILGIGRFHRSTAQRFSLLQGCSLIHPVLMAAQIFHFFFHSRLLGLRRLPQGLLQARDLRSARPFPVAPTTA